MTDFTILHRDFYNFKNIYVSVTVITIESDDFIMIIKKIIAF